MSTPHDDNSSNSEVLDAHLDAIGALTWKPFETAKRLPQTHTEQMTGRDHASERRPIGSRQDQVPHAEQQRRLDRPRQEGRRGAGGDGPMHGARQTFAGESDVNGNNVIIGSLLLLNNVIIGLLLIASPLSRKLPGRGLEQQRVAQRTQGRPPHQQPVAQSTRVYHLDAHQRHNLENAQIMEPAIAYRQQHSGWVQVRNHGYQQEQGHYAHAHHGQEHGWSHNGLVYAHSDVYQRQPNYPRSHRLHVPPHAFSPEGPRHPDIERRRGTNQASDRQHRRRGGFQGRGEY